MFVMWSMYRLTGSLCCFVVALGEWSSTHNIFLFKIIVCMVWTPKVSDTGFKNGRVLEKRKMQINIYQNFNSVLFLFHDKVNVPPSDKHWYKYNTNPPWHLVVFILLKDRIDTFNSLKVQWYCMLNSTICIESENKWSLHGCSRIHLKCRTEHHCQIWSGLRKRVEMDTN